MSDYIPTPGLNWTQVLPVLQCTNITVPLDYENPQDRQIPLMLVKLPSNNTDPSTHKGNLVFQLGGPGAISTEALISATLGLDLFGPLRNHFDIVTVEARGIAWNHAVRCDAKYTSQQVKAYPRTEVEHRAALEFYEMMGRDCLERTGEVMHFMDSRTQARDLEEVRIALGREMINYCEFSHCLWWADADMMQMGYRGARCEAQCTRICIRTRFALWSWTGWSTTRCRR
jgi:hypothetical protein